MSNWLLYIAFFFCFQLSAQNQTINIDSIAHLEYHQLSKDLYQSQKLLLSAIQHQENEKENTQLALLYLKMGIVAHLMNKPNKSTNYFGKSILLYERLKDELGAAAAYTEFANTLRNRDTQKAKSLMGKGVAIMEDKSSSVVPEKLPSAYDNYGVILHKTGEPDSALYYYLKSLRLKEEMQDSVGIPYSLQKIAMVNASEGDIDKALKTLEDALEISTAINDSLLICETYTYFGDVFLAADKFEQSAENYETALAIAKDKNIDYLVNYIYGELPDVYNELGNQEKAYEFLKEGTALKDSVLNVERVRSIAELEMFYENTQKEQKIKLLEQDVEINKLKSKQNKRAMIGSLLLLALLTSVLSLFMSRQRLKHKSALLAKDAKIQHERLASVIIGEEQERERVARELHDGLGQLLSATKMHVSFLEEDVQEDLKQPLQKSIELVDKACHEVRAISHALLPKKLADGGLEIALKELSEQINGSNQMEFVLENNVELNVFKGQKAVALYRIIQELVNNTLKHSNANKINLATKQTSADFTFTYQDNGNNFEMKKLSKGNGIGWQNIYSRLELVDGTIDIAEKSGGFYAVLNVKS